MNQIWQAVGVLTQATPSPSPTPGLREGLDESAISPGLAGFLAVFGIALVTVLLFYSLTSKLRGVRQRDGVAGPVVAGAMPAAGVVPVEDTPQPADDDAPASHDDGSRDASDGTVDDDAEGQSPAAEPDRS